MTYSLNTRIANKLTVGDWVDLKPKLDVTANDLWSIAFSFFDQRITTRYLNPIKQILDLNVKSGEGFAVVNLQCSLIETIESFYQGWIYQSNKYFFQKIDESDFLKDPNNKNNKMSGKHVFQSFFNNRIPFSLQNFDSDDFYFNVRCGLLHETQTKNGWLIKNMAPNSFYENKDDCKIIYKANLQNCLAGIIEKYRTEISIDNSDNSQALRQNFIAKFDRICKVS